DGVVVIWVGNADGEGGETFHLPVSKLEVSRDEGKPVPLTDDLAVELVTYAPAADFRRLTTENKLYTLGQEPRVPAVELKLHQLGDKPAAADGADKQAEDKQAEENAGADQAADNSVQVVRFAQFPFTPSRVKLPSNVLVEFYHPSLGGR